MNEKKELLNMLREMWQKEDSPLHRIYASWEELEPNLKITTDKTTHSQPHAFHPCPNCGTKQKITAPLENFFPYQKCTSCNQTFHVNTNLTIRKLTPEEKETPTAWFQIFEDINKKKLAITFRID